MNSNIKNIKNIFLVFDKKLSPLNKFKQSKMLEILMRRFNSSLIKKKFIQDFTTTERKNLIIMNPKTIKKMNFSFMKLNTSIIIIIIIKIKKTI